MLPTCIGISGVSRYRNDASSEDSFLASAMASSRAIRHAAPGPALLAFTAPSHGGISGLCIFRGRVGNGKRPRSVKMAKFAFGLRQAVRHRPKGGGIDPKTDMACQMHLDIFGGSRRPQQAGTPV